MYQCMHVHTLICLLCVPHAVISALALSVLVVSCQIRTQILEEGVQKKKGRSNVWSVPKLQPADYLLLGTGHQSPPYLGHLPYSLFPNSCCIVPIPVCLSPSSVRSAFSHLLPFPWTSLHVAHSPNCLVCVSQHPPRLQALGHAGFVKDLDFGLLESLADFLFTKPYFLHPALSEEQVLVKQTFCPWPVAQHTAPGQRGVCVWPRVCCGDKGSYLYTLRQKG